MKVWTRLSDHEIRAVASEVGVRLYMGDIRRDGRAWNFRLALDTSDPSRKEEHDGYWLYQRTSASYFNEGRKIAAVCWHGHRDFMRAIFALDPEARIKTAWADYRGSQLFEDIFPQTGDRNIGSMIYPISARNACACRHSGYPVNLQDGPGGQWNVKQSTMLKCPHVIMDMSHYRADGTCKCDDPQEQERMIAEWGYSRSDFALA